MIISITLALLLVVGALAGCGSDDAKKIPATSKKTTDEENISTEVVIDEVVDGEEQETVELVEGENSSEGLISTIEGFANQNSSQNNKKTNS